MIAVQLSQSLEELLRSEFRRPVADVARELLLIEGYKTGAISAGALAEELHLPTSLAAIKWLADRGIALNYDEQDFADDLKTLDGIDRQDTNRRSEA